MTMQLPERTDSSGSVHYDQRKVGRLSKGVIVLRKVNTKPLQVRVTRGASTAWELIGAAQPELHVWEKNLPWMRQGFVVNDQPRDEKVARDIHKATIGFAVARTDTGEILQTFGPNELGKAEEAASSVQLVLQPAVIPVEVDEDEQDDMSVIAAYQDSLPEPEVASPQEG